MFVDRAPRATGVIPALVDVVLAGRVIALDLLDGVVAPAAGTVSIVPCIQAGVIVVICSIAGSTRPVAWRVIVAIVVRHGARTMGDGRWKWKKQKVRVEEVEISSGTKLRKSDWIGGAESGVTSLQQGSSWRLRQCG